MVTSMLAQLSLLSAVGLRGGGCSGAPRAAAANVATHLNRRPPAGGHGGGCGPSGNGGNGGSGRSGSGVATMVLTLRRGGRWPLVVSEVALDVGNVGDHLWLELGHGRLLRRQRDQLARRALELSGGCVAVTTL